MLHTNALGKELVKNGIVCHAHGMRVGQRRLQDAWASLRI